MKQIYLNRPNATPESKYEVGIRFRKAHKKSASSEYFNVFCCTDGQIGKVLRTNTEFVHDCGRGTKLTIIPDTKSINDTLTLFFFEEETTNNESYILELP